MSRARESLQAAIRGLTGVPHRELTKQTLADLHRELLALPPVAASAVIRDFLATKADAPTGLEFKLRPDGFLSTPPTLRVLLLDLLAQIDAPAAAQIAEAILATKESADEWAVALRAYALEHGTPEGRDFLKARFTEMLAYEPWRTNPSAGYLEAFDVVVYLQATDQVPTLTNLARRTDNRAVAHAALLTLDRLALADPVGALSQLATQPDLLAGREGARANFLARANVGDSQQRAVLEGYLLDARRTPEELSAFAGVYPNANYFVSNNLLTRTVTPDRETLVRMDREALAVVRSWKADPRFERLRPQVEVMLRRMETFVRQAGGPP